MDKMLSEIMNSILEILKHIGDDPSAAYPVAGILVVMICYLFFRNAVDPGRIH